eukprot:16318129-Heterocapsa_arctica.AAC.1
MAILAESISKTAGVYYSYTESISKMTKAGRRIDSTRSHRRACCQDPRGKGFEHLLRSQETTLLSSRCNT